MISNHDFRPEPLDRRAVEQLMEVANHHFTGLLQWVMNDLYDVCDNADCDASPYKKAADALQELISHRVKLGLGEV